MHVKELLVQVLNKCDIKDNEGNVIKFENLNCSEIRYEGDLNFINDKDNCIGFESGKSGYMLEFKYEDIGLVISTGVYDIIEEASFKRLGAICKYVLNTETDVCVVCNGLPREITRISTEDKIMATLIIQNLCNAYSNKYYSGEKVRVHHDDECDEGVVFANKIGLFNGQVIDLREIINNKDYRIERYF